MQGWSTGSNPCLWCERLSSGYGELGLPQQGIPAAWPFIRELRGHYWGAPGWWGGRGGVFACALPAPCMGGAARRPPPALCTYSTNPHPVCGSRQRLHPACCCCCRLPAAGSLHAAEAAQRAAKGVCLSPPSRSSCRQRSCSSRLIAEVLTLPKIAVHHFATKFE